MSVPTAATSRLLIAASALGMTIVLSASGTAHASCTEDSGPAGSPVQFLGVAEEERRGFTRFMVVEVWEGPDLAPEVWVQSGQKQSPWPFSAVTSVGSSVDADFRDGATYLVGATDDFTTNECTITETSAGGEDLADQPDKTRAPVTDGTQGADPPIGPLARTMWVAGVLVVLGSVIALVRRSRRTRDQQPAARGAHEGA